MFYVTYIIPVVISMIDTDNFLLYAGIRGLAGGTNLGLSTALVWKTSRTILAACTNLPEDKQRALKKKFNRAVRVGWGISFVLIGTGALDATAPDKFLIVYTGFGGFILWLIFRFIFAAGLFVLYVTNKSPSKKKVAPGGAKSTIVESSFKGTSATSDSEK